MVAGSDFFDGQLAKLTGPRISETEPGVNDIAPDAIAKSFSRAACTYDRAAQLQRRVADNLMQQLPAKLPAPGQLADLGCGTGYLTECLAQRFPNSRITALDIAPGMLQVAKAKLNNGPAGRRLHWLCADIDQLGANHSDLAPQNLLISSLSFQWLADLSSSLQRLASLLQPGGHLLFSTLVAGTLNELRSAWAQVDEQIHVNQFISVGQLNQALAASGLARRKQLCTTELMRYAEPIELLRDLKTIGARNLSRQRPHGLTGKRRLQAFSRAYEGFRLADGSLPATYQVAYVLLQRVG